MEEQDTSLIYHLEELRKTLLSCIFSLLIVLPFCLYISPFCLNKFISFIIKGNNISLNFFAPVEVFIIQIKIALLTDCIICFPYIAKKLWDFILPALYENEKRFIKSASFISSFLFILGVAFCIIYILPLIINFGIGFQSSNIKAVFGISNVINLSLWLCLAFGLMFQIPLITCALIKGDIISYEMISNKRPYVVIILLIVAAILTPPDIISQILLFVPTYTLFELGLLFCRNKS